MFTSEIKCYTLPGNSSKCCLLLKKLKIKVQQFSDHFVYSTWKLVNNIDYCNKATQVQQNIIN